jgi:hypothetical protein
VFDIVAPKSLTLERTPLCSASTTFSGRIASPGNVTEVITVVVGAGTSEGAAISNLRKEPGEERSSVSRHIVFEFIERAHSRAEGKWKAWYWLSTASCAFAVWPNPDDEVECPVRSDSKTMHRAISKSVWATSRAGQGVTADFRRWSRTIGQQ